MINLKQDRNGVRTATDVERRHKLGLIQKTSEEVEELKDWAEVDSNLSSTSTHAVENKVITNAINSLDNRKINAVSGMGLSHNDFTDSHKAKLEGVKSIILFDDSQGASVVVFDEEITENTSYIDVFFKYGSVFDSIRIYNPYNNNYNTILGTITNSGITVNNDYEVYFVASFEEVFE